MSKRGRKEKVATAHLGAGLGFQSGAGPRRRRLTDHAGWPLGSLLLQHVWVWPVGRYGENPVNGEVYSKKNLMAGA